MLRAYCPNTYTVNQKGNIDLHEWLGNGWGLLFSHPAPFTPICTSEVGALAKAHKVSAHWNIPKGEWSYYVVCT